MSNNETLAAILAELRRHVQAARDYPRDIDITDGDVEDWADRIEAAVERERNRQYEPKCNWSIRDALALANTLANHGLRDGNADAASSCIYSLCRILSSPGNASAMREALENSNGLLEELAMIGEWGESAREQIAENNASLSAPVRNCDRFETEYKAHSAFCAEPCKHPCGNCTVTNVEMAHDCFIHWLFAPAEGGAE